MKKIYFLICLLLFTIGVSAQLKDDSFCNKINAIFQFFRERRLKDTIVKYPLSQKIDRSVFETSRSFSGRTTYYNSAVLLPNEAKSEFVFGDENWHYTAVLGPYSK